MRFSQPGRRDAVQHPCQFGMLVHVRLDEDGATLWVESAGDQHRVELARVGAQFGGILRHSDGVQIDDAEDVVVDVLLGGPMANRADIVAERWRVRRRDAGKHALAFRRVGRFCALAEPALLMRSFAHAPLGVIAPNNLHTILKNPIKKAPHPTVGTRSCESLRGTTPNSSQRPRT